MKVVEVKDKKLYDNRMNIPNFTATLDKDVLAKHKEMSDNIKSWTSGLTNITAPLDSAQTVAKPSISNLDSITRAASKIGNTITLIKMKDQRTFQRSILYLRINYITL